MNGAYRCTFRWPLEDGVTYGKHSSLRPKEASQDRHLCTRRRDHEGTHLCTCGTTSTGYTVTPADPDAKFQQEADTDAGP